MYKQPRRFAAYRLDADVIFGPVVVGNVGDNGVNSCRLRACETQQLAVCHLR